MTKFEEELPETSDRWKEMERAEDPKLEETIKIGLIGNSNGDFDKLFDSLYKKIECGDGKFYSVMTSNKNLKLMDLAKRMTSHSIKMPLICVCETPTDGNFSDVVITEDPENYIRSHSSFLIDTDSL